MLGKSEARSLQAVVDLLNEDPDFRPVTLEDVSQLLKGLLDEKILLLTIGSYKSRDVVIGIILKYDLTTYDVSSSCVSILYRVICEPPVKLSLVRETEKDQATKRVGPSPEVEIGIKSIDDSYIIHTDDYEKLVKLVSKFKVKNFLINFSETLEEFRLEENYLELKRPFGQEEYSSDFLKNDLENLVEIADLFE